MNRMGLCFAVAAAIGLAVVLGYIAVPRGTSASGIGGTISLGAPVGTSLPVNTTAPTDPYSGFNIHITTTISPGVILSAITGSFTGSTIDTGNAFDVFCGLSSPVVTDRVYACVGLVGQSTTAAGKLAALTFNASGNGCIKVQLVHDASSMQLDSFTTNASDNTPQTNVVAAATANVLFGTGTVLDCLDIPTPTPTPTLTPTQTPITPSATPTYTSTPTPNTTPGSIATDTPVPPPGATSTPAGNPDNEIHVLSISTSLCLAFGGSLPVPCFDMWRPASQHRLADILTNNAPEARGCPATYPGGPSANPSSDRCRLLPSDFFDLAALSKNELHADDPANSSAGSGPWSGLYIMALVPTDEPVEFRTTGGKFV